MERLWEREDEVAVLGSALDAAVRGSGSVVLVAGEAGIGKTALVRAFLRRIGTRARVLTGACDDLLTPRPLGPFHDAVRGTAGRLAEALASGDRNTVLAAALDELGGEPHVLVVEDLHWADEATLDAVRFLARRVADLPSLLVLTYRDDEVVPGSALQRLLGALGGPGTHRVALRRLSRAAVERWTEQTAAASRATPAAVYRLTGGNPFFVSEVLASTDPAPTDSTVPHTVADAVLARVTHLDGATRDALDQLAVIPTRAELPLARALLGSLTVVAEAERRGMLQVAPDTVAFRHELARRALEQTLPVTRRMELNSRVVAALLAQREPDLARVVHHAVEAGDDAVVAAHAPEAARRACLAGAQTLGAMLYGQALRRPELVPVGERAALHEAQAWAYFHGNRRREALGAAEEAVRLHEDAGSGPSDLSRALACLALQQWADLHPAAALASGERAVALLAPAGDGPGLAGALTFLAVVLINVERDAEGLARVEEAVSMARRVGALQLLPRCLLYRGRARLQLGDPAGFDEVLRGLELAVDGEDHEVVVLAYLNILGLLYRAGRFAELARYLDEAGEYVRDRDFPVHVQAWSAYRFRLMAVRGEWDAAVRGLRALVDDSEIEGDHGVVGRHALAGLARLAVRQGSDDADALLRAARENAERAASLEPLVMSALGEVEHAWLAGAPDPGHPARGLLPRTEQPGRERFRGELLRWLRRLGEPVVSFPGCPPEFAAGIDGDWRRAAAAWAEVGDPYERAWELADSGDVEATLEALSVFDGLGARPAAAVVRRRVRELGVTAVPRGPAPSTRTNPAGLTDRQVEILRLLAAGLTNAEIAARLVVSVRTVDHHVSAVLQKLGVPTRRAAAAVAAGLDLT